MITNLNKAMLFLNRLLIITFGIMSMDKNNLNEGCDCRLCIFFSSWANHDGAKWTFLSSTQWPDLLAEFIAFSDASKPSAEPVFN